MDRREKAVELKHNGHNCCQAVLYAFDDELSLAEDDLNRIGAAYGVGMGCMEAICGALCAAEMILGMKEYEGRPILRDAAALHKAFTEKCGASICKDLKGKDTGVVLCECDDCVRNAVSILEEQDGLLRLG